MIAAYSYFIKSQINSDSFEFVRSSCQHYYAEILMQTESFFINGFIFYNLWFFFYCLPLCDILHPKKSRHFPVMSDAEDNDMKEKKNLTQEKTFVVVDHKLILFPDGDK